MENVVHSIGHRVNRATSEESTGAIIHAGLRLSAFSARIKRSGEAC